MKKEYVCYEDQYNLMLKDIYENGVWCGNRTEYRTKKLPHQIIQVDLEKEFPILKSKFVAFKNAIQEILWIMQGHSDIGELQAQNNHIWDEWYNKREDHTVGECYGWVVKKYDLINKAIRQLRTNPDDRRIVINLYQYQHLDNGVLEPCCHNTDWDVTNGRLNCVLTQRSGDTPKGVPFNTTQYAVLVHLLAHVTGLKPGLLTHVISNAHIYENQMEGVKKQLENYDLMKKVYTIPSDEWTNPDHTKLEVEHIVESRPKLIINPDIKEFADFKATDITLEGYNNKGLGNMGKVDMGKTAV